MDRPALMAALRHRIARLERPVLARPGLAPVPLCPAIDAALPAGGLARAALHEVLPAEAAHQGAAAGFCAMVLARAAGPVFWIAPEPDAWPPGLARFGLDPAQLVLVRAPKPADALWAMEEALRCPATAGALLLAPGLDLTAERRLMLAAETGGGLGLLLRGEDAAVGPGAALTRWRIGGLPGSGGPHDLGDPRWRVELLRSRAGQASAWDVTWHAAGDSLLVEEAAAPVVPARRRAR
jgi:protein ImuA